MLIVSYDGTNYSGWALQSSTPNTVEGVLNRAIHGLTGEEVAVIGASRTDAGVHASMMVAHFDFSGEWGEGRDATLDGQQLTYKLNRLLPQDIAVQRVEAVSDDMHARFSAVSRTYHYFIHTVKDPFRRAYSCELHYPLDFVKMNEAAALLLTY